MLDLQQNTAVENAVLIEPIGPLCGFSFVIRLKLKQRSTIMIIIGKKWDHKAEYIGRGSPLGNPFNMRNPSERDDVCEKYEKWFYTRIDERDPNVINELSRLINLARQGDLILGCFCSPKRCHGETIKNYMDNIMIEADFQRFVDNEIMKELLEGNQNVK